MAEKDNCALILLAAGASTRMGQPKQLLPIRGKPLLRHVVESAMAEPVSPVIVVLGANAAEIAPCLVGLPVRIVINPDWPEGMGSSLRRGVEELTRCTPTVDRVIITLADQPDILSGHLSQLIATQHTTDQAIVASECEGVRGPPVLFAAEYFPILLTLAGDTGARALLKEHADDVATVPLPSARDLDTLADYNAYLENNSPRIPRIDADKNT